MRQGLPDETRIDATASAHFGGDWMVLAQAYGDRPTTPAPAGCRSRPRWSAIWATGVWRQAIAGRETPESGGPVIALWRRF